MTLDILLACTVIIIILLIYSMFVFRTKCKNYRLKVLVFTGISIVWMLITGISANVIGEKAILDQNYNSLVVNSEYFVPGSFCYVAEDYVISCPEELQVLDGSTLALDNTDYVLLVELTENDALYNVKILQAWITSVVAILVSASFLNARKLLATEKEKEFWRAQLEGVMNNNLRL